MRKLVPFTPVRVWDAATGKELFGLEWPAEKGNTHVNFPGLEPKCGIDRAQFSPDGRRVLTVENGSISMTQVDGLTGISSLSVHSHSNNGRRVRVWNAETSKEIAVLKGHWQIHAAAWSPDGERVVMATQPGGGHPSVRLWDVARGQELFILQQQVPCPYTLFSADSRRILCFQRDRLHIWDEEGSEVGCCDAPEWTAEREDKLVTFAVLSSDGRLAVALCGNEARTWDVSTGKALALLTGHEQTIHTAAFSPDGRLVATASDDETARLWDTATGAEWYTLRGHNGSVQCAGFSPDGQTVATASADGTARLWRIDLLPLARARKPRELTPEEMRRFEISPGDGR
jgi:WD40 repeat protein